MPQKTAAAVTTTTTIKTTIVQYSVEDIEAILRERQSLPPEVSCCVHWDETQWGVSGARVVIEQVSTERVSE